ncbi:glycosyltransferase [Enterococcus sp. LJL98]
MKNKKKILFYMYNLSGGGAERTIVNIINHMDRNSFSIILVLGTEKNNDYLHLVNKDIKIINLKKNKRRETVIGLKKVILEEVPDLLFSTLNNNNIILILSKILTFKKIPLIIRETNNRTEAGSVSRINKLTTYFLYNFFSTKIIALSKGVQNDLIENFKIKQKKIDVIYNPINLSHIDKLKKEKIEETYRFGTEKIIIGIGRLAEQKDFDTLIKAFAKVTEITSSKLLILGKGPEEPKLKLLCKNLGIEDKVLFLGFKNNPYKYIHDSDVFVLSSKWEGFGHVIVEAMASGTPVIATDCKSGPAEILEDNKYGVLIPVSNHNILAEKLILLLENQELLNKYIELGAIRKEKYDVQKITSQYEQVFLSLIN